MNSNHFNYIQGKIWILGDNINTDDIVPSHVLTIQENSQIISATLENLIPNFSQLVNPGDWIIAGKNFGCGSSREEAVFVLKELKLGGIIAQSFARIFYRNAINSGFLVISYGKPNEIGTKGDKIKVDLIHSQIINESTKLTFNFSPFPKFLLELLKAGGLLNYNKQLKNPSFDKNR